MGYTSSDWLERIRSRSDMTSYLFHLTKENGNMEAVDMLVKILTDKKLIGSGSNGYVIGSNRAVCFQDVPPYGLSQNCFHEQKLRKMKKTTKVRYRPVGLAFRKRNIYGRGGRPVIYEESQAAKKILPSDEWWRIVDINLSDKENITDWTHEREWRLKGDLEFELSEVHIVLTNKVAYDKFMNSVNFDIVKNLGGILLLDPVLT